MSYILDALRKSETERRQGRIPDLGQQVQLIHKPKKKPVPVSVWIGIGLMLNAVVLAVIFWPRLPVPTFPSDSVDAGAAKPTEPAPGPASAAPVESAVDGKASSRQPVEIVELEPEPSAMAEQAPADMADPGFRERPTVIVPSRSRSVEGAQSMATEDPVVGERVPHLIELPVSFQKTVPDLVFNSHIYASDPLSRRVMINNQYLRVGDRFSGIRVERITEEGVELSKDGRRFRVGVVRDWVSPR